MESNGMNSLGYATVNTKHQLEQLRNKIVKNKAKNKKNKEKQKQQQQNQIKQPYLDCMKPPKKRRRISKQRDRNKDIPQSDNDEVFLHSQSKNI